MTLKEYRQDIFRLVAPLETIQLDVCHMILGMNSEFNEIYESTDKTNLGEELTDTLWYICNYCTITGLDDIEDKFNFNTDYFCRENYGQKYILKLQSEISKLTDLEKKKLAYKKEIPKGEIETQVLRILWALNDSYLHAQIDPKVAMQRNVDKLNARYKTGKFSQTDALNRDLETERKKLEGL